MDFELNEQQRILKQNARSFLEREIAPLAGQVPFPLVPGTDYQSQSYPLLTAATQELLEEGQSKIKKR